MDEQPLAERLITYDTSTLDGLRSAAGFVKGWLESRDVDVRDHEHEGLPVITADVGAAEGSGAPVVILHGHLDVVPARPGQFEPRVDGDHLIGRGAYDMKGGLAAYLIAAVAIAEVCDDRRGDLADGRGGKAPDAEHDIFARGREVRTLHTDQRTRAQRGEGGGFVG